MPDSSKMMVFTGRQTNIRVLTDLANGLRPGKYYSSPPTQKLTFLELYMSNQKKLHFLKGPQKTHCEKNLKKLCFWKKGYFLKEHFEKLEFFFIRASETQQFWAFFHQDDFKE